VRIDLALTSSRRRERPQGGRACRTFHCCNGWVVHESAPARWAGLGPGRIPAPSLRLRAAPGWRCVCRIGRRARPQGVRISDQP